MTDIKLRKGRPEDLEEIAELFYSAIENMNNNGIPQWDEIYPNKEVLSEDISKGQLYVCESEGKIVSVGVINEYGEKYEEGNWRYKDSNFAVIHRLCVHPNYQGKGLGGRTEELISVQAKNFGYTSLRIDAFSLNPYALKMYDRLGYKKVGEVKYRKGIFYLMEKLL